MNVLVLTCSENDVINQVLYRKIVQEYLLAPGSLQVFDKHLQYQQCFKLLRVLSFLKVFYLKQFPNGSYQDELKLKIDEVSCAVRELKVKK